MYVPPSWLYSGNVCLYILYYNQYTFSRTYVHILVVTFPTYLISEFGRSKIVESFNLSGNSDTYLKGESKRSVILTFNPLARSSIVSIRGIILLLQISEIVDFGISVNMETWRTVKFLLFMYSCNKILMMTTPFFNIVAVLWKILFIRRIYSMNAKGEFYKRKCRKNGKRD